MLAQTPGTTDPSGESGGVSAPMRITSLEIHVAHGCNLACESCSHYGNHDHDGMLAVETAEHWMSRWQGRVAPSSFVLLGGEPTLNPRLTDLVRLARRYWPGALLRVSTNGFLLHRHPALPSTLRECGARLDLTVHHGGTEYARRLAPVLELVQRWQEVHDVHVAVKRVYENWSQRYVGFGSTMKPFADERPRQSWEVCPAKHAHQLHDGKIWKCGPLAYLPLQHARYALSEGWQEYLDYQPLAADCSDEELQEFFAREDEACCRMCSSRVRPIHPTLPFRRSSRAAKAG